MAFWNRDGKGSPTQNGRAEPTSSFPSTSGTTEVRSDPDENAAAPATPMVTQTTSIRQSLGRETTVTGKLSFNAPTRIDGVLNGEVRASDLLVIGEEGRVDGAVRAQQLLVLGEVRGEVHVEGRTEVAATGKLRGSLHSRHLVVHAGAFLEGELRIGPA